MLISLAPNRLLRRHPAPNHHQLHRLRRIAAFSASVTSGSVATFQMLRLKKLLSCSRVMPGNLVSTAGNAVGGLRFFSQANKAFQDHGLLEALRSEINFELQSETPEMDGSGSLGDFVMEWDSSKSQDILLRKKSTSGEEVAVSALLDRDTFKASEEGTPSATDVLMKVCIKKPGCNSIWQFDCKVSGKDEEMSGFDIQGAYSIESASSLSTSLYRGPLFSDLDPRLQAQLKKYLEARGIGEGLFKFLIFSLRQKEQWQYVSWLQILESAILK